MKTKEVLRLNKIDVGESTIIGNDVTYGQGVSIGEFCNIGNNVEFGDFVTIGNYCEIRDDCRIGDFSVVGTRSILSSGVKINDRVRVGEHSIVNVLISMETNSILRAMSVLRQDAGAHEVWDGVPAKMIRLINSWELIV